MKQRTVRVADICDMDLADMCTYVTRKYAQDKGVVSGEVFAFIAKHLVAAEVQPGGPYKDTSGKPTARVNVAVGRMFLLMGKPLPRVAAFIAGLDPQTLSRQDKDAVAAYARAQKAPHVSSSVTYSTPYKLAQTTLQQIKEPLQSQALAFLARVAAADTTKEIASIAAYAAQAFGAAVPATTLNRLGEANIYTWISYMIYDHLIDDEASPAMLPVANVAMRLALARYSAVLGNDHTLQNRIAQYFNNMDEANAWELKHCRFVVSGQKICVSELPDYAEYDVLAQRSGAHILGPLAIAGMALPKNPRKHQQFALGLRQYLIARQLSDDLHDWKEDLAAGHISAVVAQLLAHSKVAPGAYTIRELTDRLQQDFLHHTMITMSNQITLHSQSAAQYLLKAGCQKTGKLAKLVDRLAKIAAASRAEQSRFIEFSQQYSPMAK